MAEMILAHAIRVTTPGHETFGVTSWGQLQPDGSWIGWIEFTPTASDVPPLATERETTQPSREALRDWASGLEPAYIQAAFERARPVVSR